MPDVKPLKVKEGQLERFTSNDEVPENNLNLERVYLLFQTLLFELSEQGIEFESELLNEELTKFKQ